MDIVFRVCDLEFDEFDPMMDVTDAAEAERHVIVLDGVMYEVDLCPDHEEQLASTVARFAAVAKPRR